MSFLRAVGLVFWGGVIAVCLVVVGLYLALTQTILDKPTFQSWLDKSGVYQKTTDLIITPQVIANARQTITPNKLVTDNLIAASLRQAAPASVVKQKAAPAIDALYKWLDGKAPDIEFSLATDDIKQRFFDAFQKNLTAAAQKLPACDFNTTYDETFDGTCRPTFSTPEAMAAKISKEAQENLTSFNEPLTQSDIPLTNSSQSLRQLPNYLNLLWAAALGAGVLLAIAIIWLLTRRVPGLYTIATGGLLGAGGLYLLAKAIGSLTLTNSPELAALGSVASTDIAAKTIFIALLGIGVSVCVALLATALAIGLRSRRSRRRIHFS